MDTVISFISEKIVPNIAVIGVVGFTAVTSSLAAYKVSQDLPPVQQIKDTLISNSNISTINVTGTPVVTQESSNQLNQIVTNGLPAMSLADLSTHNKGGDCYIAFSGVVYNVSQHPSWNSCSHHGINGGQDITSRFPHPTSYLNSLVKVATIAGSSVILNPGLNSTEHETELEIEESNKSKQEDEHDEEEDEKEDEHDETEKNDNEHDD